MLNSKDRERRRVQAVSSFGVVPTLAASQTSPPLLCSVCVGLYFAKIRETEVDEWWLEFGLCSEQRKR